MKRTQARSLIRLAVNDSDVATSDANCDRIIDALGVVVEPDEPTLPARLVVGRIDGDKYRMFHKGDMRITPLPYDYARDNDYALRVSGSVALAEALVDAYNKRNDRNDRNGAGSTWRTDVPPAPGRYLVRRPNASKDIDRWDGNSWFADVDGWQPLPE